MNNRAPRYRLACVEMNDARKYAGTFQKKRGPRKPRRPVITRLKRDVVDHSFNATEMVARGAR